MTVRNRVRVRAWCAGRPIEVRRDAGGPHANQCIGREMRASIRLGMERMRSAVSSSRADDGRAGSLRAALSQSAATLKRTVNRELLPLATCPPRPVVPPSQRPGY